MHGGGQQVFNNNRRAGFQHAASPPKIRNLPPSYEKYRRENVSIELRREVLQKNGHRCYCCDMKNHEKGKRLELHHIVPVSFGGKTEEKNLLPLCNGCHKSVHNLISRLHINPVKFKRSALEDAVLQIAQLRHSEKARQFGRSGLLEEGLMGTAQPESGNGAEQLAPEEQVNLGMLIFVMSLAMSKRQFRIFAKELRRQSYLDGLKKAAGAFAA